MEKKRESKLHHLLLQTQRERAPRCSLRFLGPEPSLSGFRLLFASSSHRTSCLPVRDAKRDSRRLPATARKRSRVAKRTDKDAPRRVSIGIGGKKPARRSCRAFLYLLLVCSCREKTFF